MAASRHDPRRRFKEPEFDRFSPSHRQHARNREAPLLRRNASPPARDERRGGSLE
jgi:hypothetical protein